MKKNFGRLLAAAVLFFGAAVLALGIATAIGDGGAREGLPEGCQYEIPRAFPWESSVKISLDWQPGVGTGYCPAAEGLTLAHADVSGWWKDPKRPWVQGFFVTFRGAEGNFHRGVARVWIMTGLGHPSLDMVQEKPLVFTGYQ